MTRFSGFMVLAPLQLLRWYLVPDLEATTSPLISVVSGANSDSWSYMVVIGVGVRFVGAAACGGAAKAAAALFSNLLPGSVGITDCRPRPKEATEISKSKAAKYRLSSFI